MLIKITADEFGHKGLAALHSYVQEQAAGRQLYVTKSLQVMIRCQHRKQYDISNMNPQTDVDTKQSENFFKTNVLIFSGKNGKLYH